MSSSATPRPTSSSHSAPPRPVSSAHSAPPIVVEDDTVDPFVSFQELIGDSINVTTAATTKMIQVMAEVFTQQQQLITLQLENQEMLKKHQQLLEKLNETQQKLLTQEPQQQLHQLPVQQLPSPELKVEVPEFTRRSQTPAPRRRREKTAPPRERREKTEPPPKKRKFFNGPLYDQLSALLEALIAFKDSEGRQLSADFIQLPTKRELPDYYKIVTQPMDFSRIRRNLKRGHYETVDALGMDIKLLCGNCQQFNRDDSEIYKDSEILLEIWERLKASVTAMI